MLGDECVERVGVQAAVIARDRDRLRSGEGEALQRGQVGRLLDEHPVAGFDEHRRHQRQRLLGAAGDEQIVGVGLEAALGQALGDEAAQQRVALRGGVLQGASTRPLGEDGGERRLQAGTIEELRRGQAAGEGDDPGALGEGEDVADRRAGGAADAAGGCGCFGRIRHGTP